MIRHNMYLHLTNAKIKMFEYLYFRVVRVVIDYLSNQITKSNIRCHRGMWNNFPSFGAKG